jgi:(2Fe-2S) ferredoxin
MSRYEKHIFVCTNQRDTKNPKGSCASKETDLRFEFVKELRRNGLHNKVRANKTGCLDLCARGPVVVIYPNGIWYENVTKSDVKIIIEKSIKKNSIIDRLKCKNFAK